MTISRTLPKQPAPRWSRIALAISTLSALGSAAAQEGIKQLATVEVLATAEEEAKQSLGVSIITPKIWKSARRPPTCPKCCAVSPGST
ncbi:hypothetical protein [Pseudothauera nasutitermitis]|uniref:hypothetical protein n=1 Tax=Pseudothauera nasutitermitis TaxID=2565930 RepID=UPI001E448561|nr:hypothetical protein [Pseudothauera nasutitermitis]